eukprot:4617663-Pleurochrysis_carterae.AAC.1
MSASESTPRYLSGVGLGRAGRPRAPCRCAPPPGRTTSACPWRSRAPAPSRARPASAAAAAAGARAR